MADESFDYVGTIKVLLGIDPSDTTLDETLRLYLDITTQSVLNYCNIFELPSALNYTLCQLTADVYKDTTNSNKVGSVVGNVSKIEEDGRSVSFGDGSAVRIATMNRIGRLRELNRFKKLYRVSSEE